MRSGQFGLIAVEAVGQQIVAQCHQYTQRNSIAGNCRFANSMPTTPIPNAPRHTCHLRSIRSAINVRSNGPMGLAIAMMKEYSRLLVTLTPLAICRVGTHSAKP